MRSRIVLRVLAVIGTFALSATAAQAGRGSGIPAPLNTFFECQAIRGENVNATVSTCAKGDNTCTTNDGLIHSNLSIGNGVLLCHQVDAKDSNGFINPGTSFDIKCYSANMPGQKGSTVNQELVDVFTDETASVTQQPGYFCAPVEVK